MNKHTFHSLLYIHVKKICYSSLFLTIKWHTAKFLHPPAWIWKELQWLLGLTKQHIFFLLLVSLGMKNQYKNAWLDFHYG